MRTNLLFTGEALTDAPATVTQLKIAARRSEDPRATRQDDDLATTALAMIDDEVRRSHGEWRRTLDTVKETLATLERTCESAIETHDAGIAGLVEALAGSARNAAAAAAQQTRARAEDEIEELRGALERNEIALQSARKALKTAADQLDTERRERERARDAFERRNEHITSQLQAARNEQEAQKAELSTLRQHLEAERAERSALERTLQAVRNALCLAQSEHAATPPPTPVEGRSLEEAAHAVSTASPTPDDSKPDPVVDPVAIEPFPEVVEHARRLLEQAEEMYRADIRSGCPPIDVVDRLTAILRYSRDLIVGRWGSDECDAAAIFRQELGALLDANTETSFGRQLSIAAFAARSGKPPAAD
jgi:DNA repair exonuclease SbcCD ATPase subunit